MCDIYVNYNNALLTKQHMNPQEVTHFHHISGSLMPNEDGEVLQQPAICLHSSTAMQRPPICCWDLRFFYLYLLHGLQCYIGSRCLSVHVPP